MLMRKLLLVLVLLSLLSGCDADCVDADANRKQLAAEFLEGIYTGDTSVVNEIAAPDVVISYPIFGEVFDAPAIQGRGAVTKFVTGFSQRWVDGEVRVRHAVADGDIVVLVWEFDARPAGPASSDDDESDRQAWGGITLYRFNQSGQIALELGEESTPGPAARVPGAFEEVRN